MTRSGLILDDRYRLDERIAAGGVGQVWRATDLLLERPVAVKVLRPEYSDHPETLERFRKEAKNAGALSNSHVAQVYDYGRAGPEGSPYLVMEFVDGPSLADLLAVDPIEPARALDVVAQAADGLAAAHKAGVIHRDVKPGNILISREGHVKVTDFGIAHAAGQAPVTAPGLVMGTTQYMAPERIAGNPGTAASDLYALGIVLHECLTGMPPHDGTAAEVMAAHLYLPLPPLPAGVPAELDVLVDRLTTKDPARRISDAGELAEVAARLRDSIGGGALIPPARGAATSGAAAAVPGPQAPALGADPAYSWGNGGWGIGNGQPGGGMGDTTLLAAPNGFAGQAYVSDEWNVPPRMSVPAGPPGPGQPGQPGQPPGNRRRAGAAVAVGAAVLASAGLVALLVSGAFTGEPAANQAPAGPATTGVPASGQVPSRSASGAADPSGTIGGSAGPSTATPAATSPTGTPSGKKPSKSPSARPSTSAPASSSPSGGTSGSPTGGPSGGSPSSAPPSSPAGAPSSPAGASPSPTTCFLIFCS